MTADRAERNTENDRKNDRRKERQPGATCKGQFAKMPLDLWPCLKAHRSGIRQVKSEECVHLQATVTTAASPNAPSPQASRREPGWLRGCKPGRHLSGKTTDWFVLTLFWTSKVLVQKMEEENGWNKNTFLGQKECARKKSPSFLMTVFFFCRHAGTEPLPNSDTPAYWSERKKDRVEGNKLGGEEKKTEQGQEWKERECETSPNIIWHHGSAWLIPTGMKVLARVLEKMLQSFVSRPSFFPSHTSTAMWVGCKIPFSFIAHMHTHTHSLSHFPVLMAEQQLWLKFTFDFCRALKEFTERPAINVIIGCFRFIRTFMCS